MRFESFDFAARGFDYDRLCLDFANSSRGHGPIRHEFLNTYADLLGWGVTVHILTEDEADHLYALSQRAPAEAEAVRLRAIALREAVFALLSEPEPGAAALAVLNAVLANALAHRQLEQDERTVRWAWAGGDHDLESVLWPAAWSAAEVLMGEDRARVRVCEADTCDWVFLDTSRNHSRRWCSMESCGNRAKARRHYQRRAN